MRIPVIVEGQRREDARDRACAVLQNVGLGAFADLLPYELSGGQQQRVTIARAL